MFVLPTSIASNSAPASGWTTAERGPTDIPLG
jgi:hypothetical protein